MCTCIASSTVHLSPRCGDNHAHAWSCEEVDLARRRRARCMCTSRTPRPALTAPRHDVTAALSGLAAQKHEQGFGATSTQPVCMLDDATLHIEDAASCGYRYTTATRLDVYSTTHRCVEWPCFTEAKSVPPSRDYTEEIRKGPRKGHFQIARPPPREHRGQRERRRTRPWKP